MPGRRPPWKSRTALARSPALSDRRLAAERARVARPRRSTRITRLLSYHGAIRPSSTASVLCLLRFLPLEGLPYVVGTGPPLHPGAGSHVPHRSPDQARATSTPDAAWPVSRLPPDLSRSREPGSGFDVMFN